MNASLDQIEVLSVSLLGSHRTFVEQMRRTSEELGTGLGWHYLLDLSWAADVLRAESQHYVMDAGAGVGIMQWWLAAQGVNVLSVDRSNRATLDRRFRAWCRVQRLHSGDLDPLLRPRLRDFLPPRRPWQWRRWPGRICGTLSGVIAKEPTPPYGRGTVTIYNQDLANMSNIADASVDAVVSISALEHNEPDALRLVVKELMRVVKPGGKLVATLGAAKEQDWYHEPSKGWCYTEASLRDIFDLPADCPSNYDRYDELFEMLRDCSELRDSLPSHYYSSGNSGMPWGVWDPKYQPVGVVKAKRYE